MFPASPPTVLTVGINATHQPKAVENGGIKLYVALFESSIGLENVPTSGDVGDNHTAVFNGLSRIDVKINPRNPRLSAAKTLKFILLDC